MGGGPQGPETGPVDRPEVVEGPGAATVKTEQQARAGHLDHQDSRSRQGGE